MSERIVGEAFREKPDQKFSRCGAAYTDAVQTRTAVLLLRIRYRLGTRRKGSDMFAEELVTAAFERQNGKLSWMPTNQKQTLGLIEDVVPKGQISQQERQQQIAWALEQVSGSNGDLGHITSDRASALEEAHARLREQLDQKAKLSVTPYAPDVMGVYVLVPGGGR